MFGDGQPISGKWDEEASWFLRSTSFCASKKTEYARECHRFLERKHGGMNFKSWLRPLFLGSMCAHVMSEQQRKANISFFKTTRESHLKSGFHPTMFTASNKKNCYSWLIINMKIDWTLLYDIQHTSWQSVPFQAGVEIQAFRNNWFVWVGHHRRKSSEKPQREMKKCLKILRTTFQAKNKPVSISVFFPWLHSMQLLIASPVCFIFICIICIIILILIPILLNIMFMMRLYCGICIECPGRRVGQMRSPSFPKHLFESFWKSNATLSPVLGRNGGSLEDAIYLCTCIPNFMTCQKMP